MVINEIVEKSIGTGDINIEEFFKIEDYDKKGYEAKDIVDTVNYLKRRKELLKIANYGGGWKYISTYMNLPFEFIREFKDKLYWDRLVYNIPYDEEFIEEFEDRLNWKVLFLKYTFSNEFLCKHQDRIRTDIINSDL